MIEPVLTNLNFGHFGKATYGLEDNDWTSGRQPTSRPLTPLDRWRTVIPAAIRFPSLNLSTPARDVHKTTRELVRDYPDLAPAAEQLPDLEIVSAATVSAIGTYDATFGNLLAFGSIACKIKELHRPKQVAAIPTGEAGNILRLQILSGERSGWEQDKTVWVENLSMISRESGYWNEDAASIRQICFAETDERYSFLAVRLPKRSLLFHPTYIHRHDAASRSNLYDLPSSAIDIYPFHSVWIEDTGGSSHAHISFNPDYQRQFGIVDQHGQWSIWDIDDGHRLANFRVTCTLVGNLASPVEENLSPLAEKVMAAGQDGWARIMWTGDANTIVVCDRRRIAVFDIRKGTLPLKCPLLVTERSADWILDLKRHPSNRSQFFLLTSTQLFLLLVTPQNDDLLASHGESGASVLITWTHFRGMEDITLQLHTHDSGELGNMVLIYSHLNTLITLYWCHKHASDPTIACSNAEPMMLNWSDFESMHQQPHILQLQLQRADLKRLEDPQGSGPGHTYMDHDIHFYQLVAMMSDLSVRQMTLFCRPPRGKSMHLSVEPISWRKHVRPQRCIGPDLVDDEEEEVNDFVERDDMAYPPSPRLKKLYQNPKLDHRKSLKTARDFNDYASLYEALTENASSDTAETVDISVVLKEASRLLTGDSTPTELPLGTLADFAGIKIMVSDIDEASRELADIPSTEDGGDVGDLRAIASGHALGLSSNDTESLPTLSSMYDNILQFWIGSLPPDISVRVRQSKERLARRLAAEVILASMRMFQLHGRLRSTDTHRGPSQDSAVALSSTSSPPSLPRSSEPVPPDVPSASLMSPAQPSDPLSRLRKHLHIEKTPSKPVPPSISGILGHWHTGVDPGTYEWEAAELAIQDEIDQQEETSQEKREKARRKRERQEKRQRREDELFKGKQGSQPQVLRSSPGPMIGTSSSQLPTQSQSQSQGMPFGGLVVQSQVEPGRHGGRPAKKKKAKSRMSGF